MRPTHPLQVIARFDRLALRHMKDQWVIDIHYNNGLYRMAMRGELASTVIATIKDRISCFIYIYIYIYNIHYPCYHTIPKKLIIIRINI